MLFGLVVDCMYCSIVDFLNCWPGWPDYFNTNAPNFLKNARNGTQPSFY